MTDRERWRFKNGMPDTIAMAQLHLSRPYWDYHDRQWCLTLAGHLCNIPTVEAAELLSCLMLRMQDEARLN